MEDGAPGSISWSGRLRLVDVRRAADRCEVELAGGDRSAPGIAHGAEGALEPVVNATLDAIGKLAPSWFTTEARGVIAGLVAGRRVVTVLVAITDEDAEREVLGSVLVGDGDDRAAARATLDALNRPLALALTIDAARRRGEGFSIDSPDDPPA